jgi:hypothetical protein
MIPTGLDGEDLNKTDIPWRLGFRVRGRLPMLSGKLHCLGWANRLRLSGAAGFS